MFAVPDLAVPDHVASDLPLPAGRPTRRSRPEPIGHLTPPSAALAVQRSAGYWSALARFGGGPDPAVVRIRAGRLWVLVAGWLPGQRIDGRHDLAGGQQAVGVLRGTVALDGIAPSPGVVAVLGAAGASSLVALGPTAAVTVHLRRAAAVVGPAAGSPARRRRAAVTG